MPKLNKKFKSWSQQMFEGNPQERADAYKMFERREVETKSDKRKLKEVM